MRGKRLGFSADKIANFRLPTSQVGGTRHRIDGVTEAWGHGSEPGSPDYHTMLRRLMMEADSGADYVSKLKTEHTAGEFRLDTQPIYPDVQNLTEIDCG